MRRFVDLFDHIPQWCTGRNRRRRPRTAAPPADRAEHRTERVECSLITARIDLVMWTCVADDKIKCFRKHSYFRKYPGFCRAYRPRATLRSLASEPGATAIYRALCPAFLFLCARSNTRHGTSLIRTIRHPSLAYRIRWQRVRLDDR